MEVTEKLLCQKFYALQCKALSKLRRIPEEKEGREYRTEQNGKKLEIYTDMESKLLEISNQRHEETKETT